METTIALVALTINVDVPSKKRLTRAQLGVLKPCAGDVGARVRRRCEVQDRRGDGRSVGSVNEKTDDFDKASVGWWRRNFPDAPTVQALQRHAQRFGPEGVNEIAEVYGDLTAVPASVGPKRMRRTGLSLRSQVLALRDRGIVPSAIADTLNVSDRRVREILAAADTSDVQEAA
jgi:hypothetical protein